MNLTKRNFKIVLLHGNEITPFLSSIAKLVIDTFKEYPYLHQDDLFSLIEFLKMYSECPESTVLLVLDCSNIVGISSGIPTRFDSKKFQKPFIDNGIDVNKVYYLGDSILLPIYRGKKIYRDFFIKREMAAAEFGYSICAFVSVERISNDPRRPDNYFSLEEIWLRYGYKKYPELTIEQEWVDVGDKKPSKKNFVYWLKYLKT
jgi:hypothetical protein